MRKPLDTKTLEKFLYKIEFDQNGCWLWTGKTITPNAERPSTYAYFSYGVSGKVIRTLAQRYIYNTIKADLDPKTLLRNKCGNLMCVNPEHWYSSATPRKCSTPHLTNATKNIIVKQNDTGKVAFLCSDCHALLGIRQAVIHYE